MKKIAELLDRDKLALERIGVPAAANIGNVLLIKAKLAFESSPKAVVPVIAEWMSRLEPIILDGMVAAHLSARARALRMAAQAKVRRHYKLSAYDEALAYYKKRLDLSSEDIAKLRKLYGNEAAKVTRTASKAVEDKAAKAIMESLEAGEHIKLAQARLMTALESAGISEPSPFLCETLVRTGIAQAYAAGQYNVMADPDLADVHKGWQYVTVGDNRVREEHEELDGMTADEDNEVWDTYLPPLGFNCRCCAIPLFSDVEENIPDDLPEIDPEWAYDKRAAYVDHFSEDTGLSLTRQIQTPHPSASLRARIIDFAGIRFGDNVALDFLEGEHPRDEHGKFTSGGIARTHVDTGQNLIRGRMQVKKDFTAAGLDPSSAGLASRSVEYYTGAGYNHINGELRGDRTTATAGEHVRQLDRFLKISPKWPEDHALYRGIPMTPDQAAHFTVGSEFSDKGYTSSTDKKDWAQGFAEGKWSGGAEEGQVNVPVIIEMKNVKSGVSISHLSEHNESEVLLPRGAKFKVMAVEKRGETIHVVAEPA